MWPLELWQISCRSVTSDQRAAFRNAMTVEERARADTYRQPDDQLRSEIGRGLLRLRTAALTGQRPEAFDVATHDAGKPYWRNLDCPFNVSHSGDWVFVALGGAHDIGVDVQRDAPSIDAEAIGDYALSDAEQTAIRSAPPEDRRGLFFTFWVLREAALKATGQGVFRVMKSVSALPVPGDAWQLAPGFEREALWTRMLPAPDGYHAAMATLSPDAPAADLIRYSISDWSLLCP